MKNEMSSLYVCCNFPCPFRLLGSYLDGSCGSVVMVVEGEGGELVAACAAHPDTHAHVLNTTQHRQRLQEDYPKVGAEVVGSRKRKGYSRK